MICLHIQDISQKKPPSRRGMLFTISSIFDPLRLAAPFFIERKTTVVRAM